MILKERWIGTCELHNTLCSKLHRSVSLWVGTQFHKLLSLLHTEHYRYRSAEPFALAHAYGFGLRECERVLHPFLLFTLPKP